MIEIDGNSEEGGGQILRTALALSVITKKPFRIFDIRKERKDSGLKKQHIEAINTLKKLCNAEVTGDSLGSMELTFDPGVYKPQNIDVDIETAGSITLLMQSLLIPAIRAKKKTSFVIKGGTDVSWSMPIDYFKHVFIPHLKKYADIECNVVKRGYFPKGNGVVEINIRPKENEQQIICAKQGKLLGIQGIVNASLSLQERRVAERIAQAATTECQKIGPVSIKTQYFDSLSDGTGIVVWAVFTETDDADPIQPIIIGADRLGELHVSAEDIGRDCAKKLKDEIFSLCAVDKHCADNLIPYLGMYGGKIKTSEITAHTRANIYVTEKFLDVKFLINENKKEIAIIKQQ